MYQRAIEVDRRLGDILGSASTGFLQALWPFDELRYDLNVPLLNALSERQEAARVLLESYSSAVMEMRLNIARTQSVVDATRLTDLFNSFEVPETTSETDPDLVNDFLRSGTPSEHVEAAQGLSALSGIQTESEADTFFRETLQRIRLENQQVIQVAARLWAQAAERDAEASRAQLISAVVNAGLSLIQTGVSFQSAPFTGDASWWYSETWSWGVDPNGAPTIVFERTGGEGGSPPIP